MKSQKMVKVKFIEQKYFVIYIMSPVKIQKILKQTRLLLETVKFPFMQSFDLLVKIAIFRVFLLFLGDLHHALQPKSNT